MKVSLCGEEKAALPIKVGDVEAALKSEFIHLVPGSRDIEGRQVRASSKTVMCPFAMVMNFAAIPTSPPMYSL